MFMDDVTMVNVDDQFMLGTALMAAPVIVEGARDRFVRFPDGTWYDFETGEAFEGGKRRSVKAPLDAMPLFARAGALVPLDPGRGDRGTSGSDVELRLFMPTGDGEFVGGELYRDAGDGWGPWLLEKFEVVSREATVVVTRLASGDFTPQVDHFTLRLVGDDDTAEIMVDGNAVARENGVFIVPATFNVIEI
jgi:alpha-glucosidase